LKQSANFYTIGGGKNLPKIFESYGVGNHLVRISHQRSSRGGAEARGYKARDRGHRRLT
jgi:hypothetical protein